MAALAVRYDEEIVEEVGDGVLQLRVGEVALEVAFELVEEGGERAPGDLVACLLVLQVLTVAAESGLVRLMN